MQTTLLGLAIAFIIALLSALIGPYFIDWSQFRPQFEAEATRVIGAPVRVDGALDARLLPTPSLLLRSIVVGGANDLGKVRAEKLDVEFSLGALMRGEWRATELTINGVALDLGLDRQGRIDWPASSGNFNLGSLTVDRLNLTGRVALHDAASRSTLELSDIAFSGDVRGSAGAVRGDGNFTWSDARYPFRISSSQSSDGNGVRLHLALEPGEHGTSADLDGVLAFEGRMPRFDGALTLASGSPGKADAAAGTPWRISAKLKADAARARLEQVETSYGSDDAALKFTGSADMRFGASPLLQASLAARQLDADKLLAKQATAAEPMRWLPGLRALIAEVPHAPLPMQVDVAAEQVMLGGRPIQDFDTKLRIDSKSWTVERMAFRAPGSTRVSLRGAVASSDPSAGFRGALDVDSSDPNMFAAWLTGRTETAYRSQKPLRIGGRVDLTSDRVAIADLKAEIDGGVIAGRMALSARGASGGSEFDAALTADKLDLDAAAAFIRAIGGSQTEWPDRAQLALNIANAVSSGQELRPFVAKLGYDAKTVTLEQLKIGSASGVTVDGAGVFDRDETTGKLTLNAAAKSVDQLTSLLAPLAPTLVERINASTANAKGAAQLKLAVDLAKDSQDRNRAAARAAIDINLPQVSGVVTLTGTSAAQAVRGIDLDALGRSEFAANWKLSSPHGQSLLNLLGLDRVVVVADAPTQFEGTASGKWRTPLRVQAKLSGADLDAQIQGTVAPSSEQPTADVSLTVRRGNFAPLFNLKPSDPIAQGVSLSSHLTVAQRKFTFGDIDGAMAGARMRGRIAVTLGDENAVDGELGMDTLDLSQAFGVVIGSADGGEAGGPLGRGLLRGWTGQLAFQALRGTLPGGSELRPVSGVIKSDGQSLSFDHIKGGIGGGEVTGDIDAKQSSGGLALNARVQLAGVDGSALRYRALAMPAGRTTMRMTLASQGRSSSALTGALSGSGSLTLESARIAGLDAKAIDVAIAASDSGQVSNEDTLRKTVEAALSAGHLAVGTAQIPFNVRDGRLSVSATTLEADGAKAVVSGGYDVAADQADIRVNLTSASVEQVAGRPAIEIFAVGSPDALHRTVDVAALSSWLAVRAIDRETRRLDALERSTVPRPAVPPPIVPPPAVAMTPPSETAPVPDLSAPDAVPGPGVPLPDSDPRRSPPKPKAPAPQPAAIPQAANALPGQQVAPLPPPIEIRPAPGVKSSRPRAPLVIAPPVPNTGRPGF